MRAIQVAELTGPDSALKLVDIPEPEPSHMLTPGSGVVVDGCSAAGVGNEFADSRRDASELTGGSAVTSGGTTVTVGAAGLDRAPKRR